MAFERVRPEEVGVESGAVRALLRDIQKENLNLHGILLMRHGKVFAEGYVKPYRADLTHMLFSMTKPFMSAAIGLCVEDGLLSVDDYLVDIFADKLTNPPCENMRKMQVRHVLTMTTGHTKEPRGMLSEGDDWVKAFMESYVEKEPGTAFLYNTCGSYMLSAIVSKVTGKNCIEFLRERLFEPMGFAPFWSESCPMGNSAGGVGLNLRLEDLAKFCTLMLNRGVWEGKRLISAEWIDELSQYKSCSPFGGTDWESGYSYHFWLARHEGVFRGDGAMGQHGIIMPKQDMVITMYSCTHRVEKTLELFWEHLLPALHDEPIEAGEDAELLEKELDALHFEALAGEKASAYLPDGGEYELSDNGAGIKTLGFTFGEEAKLHMTFGEHDCVLPMGYGCFKEGDTGVAFTECSSFSTVFYEHCALSYAWENERTLKVKFIWNTTPFTHDMTVAFDECGCIVDWESPYGAMGSTCRKFKAFGRRK